LKCGCQVLKKHLLSADTIFIPWKKRLDKHVTVCVLYTGVLAGHSDAALL